MYKVSIITSIFKSESFIEHFLADVARQTIFPECELLLLDAQSPENERKYIDEFVKVFPKNVKYVRMDKQYTIYETWNLGAQMAQSDIVTNWNTDDRRTFNSLDLQYREFADPTIDVVYGPTVTTYVPNENTEFCYSQDGFGCYDVNYETLIRHNSPHCLPMWRKNLHDRFGYFDVKYPICADYEMWLRALAGGAKFKRINQLVGSYYRNPVGNSSNPANLQKAYAEIAEIQEKYTRK